MRNYKAITLLLILLKESSILSLAQAEGEDDKCELPGCPNKKRVEGTRVFDYCCRQHAAQDEPGREGNYNIDSCNKS